MARAEIQEIVVPVRVEVTVDMLEEATNFTDVGLFHEKFGLTHVDGQDMYPHLLDEDTFDFRFRFLREELEELMEAYEEGDLPKAFDALLDLVYVALGTAHMMELPWQEGWDEVQRANMAKERSTGSTDQRSTRGNALDVVKPDGWTPPDIVLVLAQYGYGS